MTNLPMNLGFLASGNGSSAQAIVAAIESGSLPAKACLMVSNRKEAPALDFAARAGIPALWIPTKSDPDGADARLAEAMAARGVELIVLSGYLRHIGPRTLAGYPGKILNIHPGPLPAFGGPGMYGRAVHDCVIASGIAESAITIHVVDGDYDRGPVIAREPVAVVPFDTAAALEERIKAREPAFFLRTLQRLVAGEIGLGG